MQKRLKYLWHNYSKPYIVVLDMNDMMNKLTIYLFLILATLGLSAQEMIFEDDFSDNSKEWRLMQSSVDNAKIETGVLRWKHEGAALSTINHYINQLDDNENFEISATFKPYKMGSEYGLFWGGINKDNANYFFIRGKKYRSLQVSNSKISIDSEYKTNMYIRMDANILTIRKQDNMVTIYVNDTKIFEESARVLMGKGYGFVTAGKADITIDDFTVKGTKLPINTLPDLYYAEEPENLGPAINSKHEELTPVIAANGKGIFFSRRFSPNNIGGSSDQQDIYYSSKYNGEWTEAYNLGEPLNNHGPNAVCAVTPDGNTVLLMNTYDSFGKQKGQGLSMSEKTSTGWSVPKDVKIKGYYNKSEFNDFILSNDGKVILLSINRDDTFGERDLYVSFNEGNGFWSTPKNMGSTINTPGKELSPFLASDGVTLYFSSTGHPGYGKNDIFMSKRLDDSWTKWSEPQNLGKPLNSVGWDAYYSVPADGEYAYFVSSENSYGGQDIFKIKLPTEMKPEPVVLVKGYVLNSKTKEPISTSIAYEDLEMGREVGIANSDPKTGYYEIVLPLHKTYGFFADKEGFYSVRDNIDLTEINDYHEVERNLYLTPIEVGQTVQLNNIFFYRGKARLQTTSYAELDKLVLMLKENSRIEIMLEGHTDNQGSEELNLILSEDRVMAVKKYLIMNGISETRISGRGWGGEKPIADNSTEQTRKLNRRVEFKIMKY